MERQGRIGRHRRNSGNEYIRCHRLDRKKGSHGCMERQDGVMQRLKQEQTWTPLGSAKFRPDREPAELIRRVLTLLDRV